MLSVLGSRRESSCQYLLKIGSGSYGCLRYIDKIQDLGLRIKRLSSLGFWVWGSTFRVFGVLGLGFLGSSVHLGTVDAHVDAVVAAELGRQRLLQGVANKIRA